MIQKIKKKPVEIEAIQYTGKNDFEIGKWFHKIRLGKQDRFQIINN